MVNARGPSIVNALIFLILALPWMLQVANLVSFGFFNCRLVWMPEDDCRPQREGVVVLIYVVSAFASLFASGVFLASAGDDDGED